jgi:hypothetical protein
LNKPARYRKVIQMIRVVNRYHTWLNRGATTPMFARYMEPLDPVKKSPTSPLIPPINFAQFDGKPKNLVVMSWARVLVRRMNEAQENR